MIPSVFVSSTIRDLQHLRDDIRDAILDLAYFPVLSEYGDVGYLPHISAPESCYVAAKDCHLAVLIIGKQYGSVPEDGISVTHQEFRSLRQEKVPIITLVDREVWTFKRVFDANAATKPAFPGMDAPAKTFGLIQEIIESATNNGVLPFEHVAEARGLFKKQVAHFVGERLRPGAGTIKSDLKDVLSEIMALRKEVKKRSSRDDELFVRIARCLLEDRLRLYKEFLECIFGSLENAIPKIAFSPDFRTVAAIGRCKLTILPQNTDFAAIREAEKGNTLLGFDAIPWDSSGHKIEEFEKNRLAASFVLLKDRRAFLNDLALVGLDVWQNQLMTIAKETLSRATPRRRKKPKP